MFDCTCPASRGLQGRICGVNHPDCEALKGLSRAALDVVVPSNLAPTAVFGTDTPPTSDEARWLIPAKRGETTAATGTSDQRIS